MSFDFLAPFYLQNRGGTQNDHKKHLTSKISVANILIREIKSLRNILNINQVAPPQANCPILTP